MSVLVLGGAGYIGAHTVYDLIEHGFDTVVVDNLQTGFKKLLHPLARFYQGDIRNKEFIDHVFKQENIECVIHFAANSLVGVSVKEPLEYYHNNVYGTMVVLQSMKEHGVGKIVFSSTAATYGEAGNAPIVEGNKNSPTNPYGETKLTMEKMMHWCDEAYGIKYVALRYFNACGAHTNQKIGEMHNPETHLIPLVLQVPLKKREFITVFGNDYDTKDGTCIRDYVHVCDLSDAHILAMQYLMKGGKSTICNLGSGVGYSVLDIIKATEIVTNQSIKTKFAGRRAGDPAVLVASNAKACELLDWMPKFTNITEIIKSAWDFYTNNNY